MGRWVKRTWLVLLEYGSSSKLEKRGIIFHWHSWVHKATSVQI